MFVLNHPLDGLKPAAYNPRRITPDALQRLGRSIRELGIVRAPIFTDRGIIIAGHQRTRAMQALGIERTPAHVLHDVSTEDEIRFNQLHNASDVEIGDGDITVPRGPAGSWRTISPRRLRVAERPRQAAKLNEVCRLLAKHGPWGNAVATASGRVIACKLYAHACALLGIPLHVCYIRDDQAVLAAKMLAGNYGRFSYDHLPRTTWVQSLAQMYRLRSGRHGRGQSRTYEEIVLPLLRPGMRILDFGAGQMDYARLLRRRGYEVCAIEFFRRRPGSLEIDLPAVHRDIDRLCSSLRRRGLFDLVVCDSVLNSVDSRQAEEDVLRTIQAMCRPSGLLVFSGRRREFEHRIEFTSKRMRSVIKRNVYFVDRHGFSAMYQRGVWMFQRFHTDAETETLARRFIGPGGKVQRRTSGWAASGKLSAPVDTKRGEESIAREFDLPLPDGSRVARSADVLSAWRHARAKLA